MPSPNGIKAVFFDFDGTLHFDVPSGREFFIDYVATLGIPISEQDRQKAVRWEYLYWAESDDLNTDRAAYPEQDAFWINYCARQLGALGCESGRAALLAPKIFEYMGLHYKPENQPDPAAATVLADLQRNGYLLGVISNRTEPFDEDLAKLGLAQFFGWTVSGSDAGVKKPDPAIFEYALQRAGVSADEAVYVGDNYYVDITGARNARIAPVLVDRDRVFNEPDCPVISSLAELPAVLQDIATRSENKKTGRGY